MSNPRINRSHAQRKARATLAAWPPAAPLFPAPSLKRGSLSWVEWELFHARLAANDAQASLPILWERPTPETVGHIWPFLGCTDWTRFVPSFPPLDELSPEEHSAAAARVKAAIVVAVRAVLAAGRTHDKPATGLFLVADLVDALARGWSPSYWAICARTPAVRLHHMTEQSQRHVRRDLLCQGLNVEAIWQFCTQPEAGRLLPYTITQRPDGTYRVDLRHLSPKQQALYTDVEEWLEGDPSPGISFTKTRPRLMEATHRHTLPLPAWELADEDYISKPRICGEQLFHVSTVGPRGAALLGMLEQSIVWLDVDAFLSRVEEAVTKWRRIKGALHRKHRLALDDVDDLCSRFTFRPRRHGKRGAAVSLRDLTLGRLRHQGAITPQQVRKITTLLRAWDREDWILSQCGHVADEVRSRPRPTSLAPGEPWYLPIRSDYIRTINGRWQPIHFGPLYVSAKPAYLASYDDEGEEIPQDDTFYGGLRRRWFKAPAERAWFNQPTQTAQEFVSVDVSSSQIQIIALLTGNLALYEAACRQGGQGFKLLLAELAWPHVTQHSAARPDGYKFAEGKDGESRLVQMVKAVVMRYLYGSTLGTIRRDHRKDAETFGPGFPTEQAIRAFLMSIPGWTDLERFLAVTRQAALNAARLDPYAGFIFRDPFDSSTTVRWNPIRTRSARVGVGTDLHITTQQPAGPRETTGPWAGDYPVDGSEHGELYRLVPPSLIHRLDGAFSGSVVEAFWRRGLTNFFAVHDSWGVPAQVTVGLFPKAGHEVLDECLLEAMADWLPRLGSVYEDLLRYLPAKRQDPAAWQHRATVLRWQASWRLLLRRGEESGDWPGVRVSHSRATGRMRDTPRRPAR